MVGTIHSAMNRLCEFILNGPAADIASNARVVPSYLGFQHEKKSSILDQSSLRGVHHGRTIPMRGMQVTIQLNACVLESSVGIGHTSCEAGKVFTACKIRNRHTVQFEIHRE